MHQLIFCKCNQDLHHSSTVNSVKLKPYLFKETLKQKEGKKMLDWQSYLAMTTTGLGLCFYCFWLVKRFESWFIPWERLVSSARCNCHLIYSNKIVLIKDSWENKKKMSYGTMSNRRIIHFHIKGGFGLLIMIIIEP